MGRNVAIYHSIQHGRYGASILSLAEVPVTG